MGLPSRASRVKDAPGQTPATLAKQGAPANMTGFKPPASSDIEQARQRLVGHAVRTPMLEVPYLNEICGGRVLIKPECLQRTGSFKFRGAWNCISQLDKNQWPGGVVAYSSGNHAQGVAAAAALSNLKAVIVMPSDTPQIKKDNTRRLGADIVEYDRASEAREEIAADLARSKNAAIIPPYEHPHIIAGQGTAAAELFDDVAGAGARLDQLVVPAGGGGLLAGSSLASEAMSPDTAVYSAEPAGFDDHARSLQAGVREANPSASGSICDALLSPAPGELTFSINQSRLAGGLCVSDDEVRQAVRFAFMHLKLVVEPGGSVALTSLLTGKLDTRGKTTGIILSGGNVDPAVFCSCLVD
jgi:threonine dehydratase